MTDAPHRGKDCVLAWEGMPDALQGRLAQLQCEWFDEHLAGCDACRRQFDFEQRLQRALSLPPGSAIDAGAGLQRLLSRIDRPEVAPAWHALAPGRWAGRALVAAVVLQAVGLGVMGAKLWSLQPAPEYRTLSREAAPSPAGAIRLVPDPGLTVADWDALLRAHGLRVVAGPNDVGAYMVAPRAGTAPREAIVARLRAAPGIRFAEPVAGAP